jgi:phosphinothricin acetyltransferase
LNAATATAALGTSRLRLCEEAERLGFLKLVSRIFPENAASLALHRKVGFREPGVYRRHGQLDGQWRDCVIVEKLSAKLPKPECLRRGAPHDLLWSMR